jgi:hypothetical protein
MILSSTLLADECSLGSMIEVGEVTLNGLLSDCI